MSPYVELPFTLIDPATNSNPSTIGSLITTSFATPPSFLAMIVYSISSPSTTYPNSVAVFTSFSALIIGPLYLFVIVNFFLPSSVVVSSTTVLL